MRERIHLIMGSLFIGLFIACTSSTNPIASQLKEAEQLTWTHPDSALQIVQSIPHPERLTGKEQADYALLLSHLQYRCDVPFTSDSLVNIAWAYYKNSDDKNKRGKAWYMKGTVLEEFENKIPEALAAYLQAEDCILDMTDRYLPGRIYRCLGLLNSDTHHPHLAIAYYQKALVKDKEIKDMNAQVSNWLNLFSEYLILQKKDSVRWTIEQMQQLETDIQNSVLLAKVYHNVAVGRLHLGDSTQTELSLLKALALTPHQPSIKTLSQLAKLYLHQGKEEKADSLYKQVLTTSKLSTQAAVYGPLYREALSNQEWEKAARYASQFIDIQRAYYIQNRHKEILEIQKKYDYMKVLYQKAQMKNRFYLIILLLVGMIGIAFYAFRLYIKKIRKYYLLLQAEVSQLKFTLSEAKEREIDSREEVQKLQIQLTNIQGQETRRKEEIQELQICLVEAQKQERSHKEEVQTLQARLAEKEKEVEWRKKRMRTITRLETNQMTDEYIKMMEVITKLIEKRTCDLKQDRIYIRRWINLSKDNLVDKLSRTHSRYKEKQIDICCLLLLGFTIDEVAQLMEVTIHTLERYMSHFCRDNNFQGKGKTGFLAFLNTHTLITDENRIEKSKKQVFL